MKKSVWVVLVLLLSQLLTAQEDMQLNQEVEQLRLQVQSLQTQLNTLRQEQQGIGIQGNVVGSTDAIPALLLMVVFLFGIVGILMFWVRGKVQHMSEEKVASMHAQLHLKNYLKHALSEGESVSSLRKHFATQGWNDDDFDDALEEAMKTQTLKTSLQR